MHGHRTRHHRSHPPHRPRAASALRCDHVPRDRTTRAHRRRPAPGARALSNADIVRTLYERGYTGGDEDVFRRLYAPGFVHHSKVLHDVPPGGEGERQSMLAFRAAMPDARFDILRLVEDGDIVVAHMRVTGTPVRDYGHNVHAGEPFDTQSAAMFRLEDGLLAEEWYFVDGGSPAAD